MRPEDKERLLIEVESRVVSSRVRASAEGHGASVEEVLGETLFQEQRRIKSERPNPGNRAEYAMWEDIRRALPNASENELRSILEQVVRHYAHEIVGNFNRAVYGFTTRMLPPSLGFLLNAVSPRKILEAPPKLPDLQNTVLIQGEVEYLHRLNERGTLVMVPTHLSNMDSIIIGWALYAMGLPPALYGAGLNLFTNPVLGFFMRNLGAYTVDRRKTHNTLYKEVLKTYATCTLEYGYNNLFFPGGTRSRSGAVERHLKLGLVGSGLTAYVNNLLHNRPRPNLFIVPCTLSYQLVLEAETLIDDWLQEAGKSRYIITDDEFSKPKRIAAFVSQLFSLESRIYVTVGRALDPFGNPVDEDGISRDPVGRPIDISRYVLNSHGPIHDAQRDAEYTQEAGTQIVRAFLRDNVVYSTHAVARAMSRLLHRHNPDLDLFRLLRTGGRERNVELLEMYREVEELLEQLKALKNHSRIRLDKDLESGTAEEVVADALRHFAIYHTAPAVQRRGDRLFATDRNLMLYYANRLDGYGLDKLDATGRGARPVD